MQIIEHNNFVLIVTLSLISLMAIFGILIVIIDTIKYRLKIRYLKSIGFKKCKFVDSITPYIVYKRGSVILLERWIESATLKGIKNAYH